MIMMIVEITIVIMMMMMMMIIIIMIMIMIIIIAMKGEIQDFYILLTAPQTVSNTYTPVAQTQSCTNHEQHIERLSHATCSVLLARKGRLSFKCNRV